jgi:hypothetical protein
MLAAAHSIAAGDSALEVVLGLGVVLTFGGVLLRALAARFPGSRAAAPVRARRDVAGGPTPEPRQRASSMGPSSPLEEPTRALAVIADVCEPETRSVSDDCLAPLARTLDGGRRMLAAEERVGATLARLPVGLWLIERNVLVGARRIPFVALGATGVFAICPSDGAWNADDFAVMSDLAGHLARQLPGYESPGL